METIFSIAPIVVNVIILGLIGWFIFKIATRKKEVSVVAKLAAHEAPQFNGVAAVLSVLIPGLGHLYRGRLGAGFLWFVGTVIGYVLMVIPGIVLHLACIYRAGASA